MNNLEKLLINLKEQFETFSTPEKEFHDKVHKQVKKMIWSTEPQIHLELFKLERSRISKGRLLKKEPLKKECCVKTCFDVQGKPIYEEEWGSHPIHGHKKYFIYSKKPTLYL